MSHRDQGASASGFRVALNEGVLGMLGAGVILIAGVVWSARAPNLEKTDFSLIYVGAQIVHQGFGPRLYDIDFQTKVRDSLFAHPNPLLYEHPPFEALLLSPLVHLSFRRAYLIWGMFNALTCLLVMFFLRPYLPRPHEDLGYVCLWLLFAPLAVALYQGQSSLLLLALYAIAFVILRQGHELTSGMVLGFGLLKLQFVLPFALIFLFRRRWRFVAGFMITSLLLTLLSVFAVGAKGVLEYVQLLSRIENRPESLSYGSAIDMPTIFGFLYAVAGHKLSQSGLNLGVAMISIVLLGLIALRWGPTEEGLRNEVMPAAAIGASLLTGGHMFMHDFSPLLIALLVAVAYLPRGSRASRIGVSVTAAVFWIFPIYFFLVARHCLYLMCLPLLLFTLSVLWLAKPSGQGDPAVFDQLTQALP